jgi:nucleotide-binding universal stress UspA family protein
LIFLGLITKYLYNKKINSYIVTIQRILLAVDGSKSSLNASSEAIDLAKKLEAELIIIHVVSSDIRYNYLEDTITPRLPRALKDVMMIATYDYLR